MTNTLVPCTAAFFALSLLHAPVVRAQDGDDWDDELTPAELILMQEIKAIVGCKSIYEAQVEFRAKDRDGNKVKDYWTGDIHALYFLCPSPDGKEADPRPTDLKAIRLIGRETALADTAPLSIPGLAKAPPAEPQPHKGYLYMALAHFDQEGKLVPFGDANHRNKDRFAIAAVPVKHGKDGNRTFIMDEKKTIWGKDTGGKFPDAFPGDPEKAGWREAH